MHPGAPRLGDPLSGRLATRRITCPVQVLGAIEDDLTDLHGDILPIWHRWADDVTGHAIPGGHHMAEDAPTELAAALAKFWSRPDGAAIWAAALAKA